MAYTKIFPGVRLQIDGGGRSSRTRNNATDYVVAPAFSWDVMGRKTQQRRQRRACSKAKQLQLPRSTADRLNGFKGRGLGKLARSLPTTGNRRTIAVAQPAPVPTISSTNRLDSTRTVMGTATVFKSRRSDLPLLGTVDAFRVTR